MTYHRSVVIAVALPAAALLAACTGTAAVDQSAGGQLRYVNRGDHSVTVVEPAQRAIAPKVGGKLLDGSTYDLAARRGAVVVLNFWGSWCAPCRAEAPNLEQVYQTTKASGVAFVGIDVKDEVVAAQAMQREYGVSYPSIFDPSQSVALRFRNLPPTAIPSTLVVDRQGRIAARVIGAVTADQLLPVVQRIAAEPAP